MANPSIEQVTRELIRRLQVQLGGVPRGPWDDTETYEAADLVTVGTTWYRATSASTGVDPATDNGSHWTASTLPNGDVYGSGGVTAIEVVATETSASRPERLGDPVREVQDMPHVEVMGPRLLDSAVWANRAKGDRTIVSVDTDALTFQDAPAPMCRDLEFQLIGYSVRETVARSGAKGILWLMQQLVLFGSGDVLFRDDWPSDTPDFTGYYFESTAEPGRIPGKSASLHACSATVRVYRVNITDDTNGTGLLTGELHLAVAPSGG